MRDNERERMRKGERIERIREKERKRENRERIERMREGGRQNDRREIARRERMRERGRNSSSASCLAAKMLQKFTRHENSISLSLFSRYRDMKPSVNTKRPEPRRS